MGYISRKLGSRLEDDPQTLEGLRGEIASLQRRTDLAPDPVHAAYVCVQNITSVFAEAISPLPEMGPYYEAAAKAEDEYMPGGPPMSPLTNSYFTAWAFFDLRFGRDRETIGTILLDLAESLGLSPLDRVVARQFQESRMGIYEHDGSDGPMTRLRELLTDEEFACIVPAGYAGQKGELWYVRLCPPTQGFDHHVAFTTPYILQRASKEDWVVYLERSLDKVTGGDLRRRLYHLLKFGQHVNGWHEFIFQAYAGHQPDAIFLAGLPDKPETLPHADPSGKRVCG